MGWKFRKSAKVGPIRVNFSKSGIGASIGVRGLRVGVNAKGQRYGVISIPGTGISHEIRSKNPRKQAILQPLETTVQPIDDVRSVTQQPVSERLQYSEADPSSIVVDRAMSAITKIPKPLAILGTCAVVGIVLGVIAGTSTLQPKEVRTTETTASQITAPVQSPSPSPNLSSEPSPSVTPVSPSTQPSTTPVPSFSTLTTQQDIQAEKDGFNAIVYDPPSNCRIGAGNQFAVKEVFQKGYVKVDPQSQNDGWYREIYKDCWIHQSQIEFIRTNEPTVTGGSQTESVSDSTSASDSTSSYSSASSSGINPERVNVRGYYRNGHYVQSHQRTAPNHTTSDNLSSHRSGGGRHR